MWQGQSSRAMLTSEGKARTPAIGAEESPADSRAWRQARHAEVDAALRRSLLGRGRPAALVQAMRYALLGPGKRIRPLLVFGAAEAVSGAAGRKSALSAACAVEMVHAYSLVHDDLPAMDDDALRRGRPTVHIRFGEAVAILAGDALLTEAFVVLVGSPGRRVVDRTAMVGELARASGIDGMVGGQCRDLEAERSRLGLSAVRQIHAGKTGALIRASVRLGALAVAATPHQVTKLTRFGEALGLAFQIADDLLDETALPGVLGREGGGDRTRGKRTYPGLLGVEGARLELRREARRAEKALDEFGRRAAALRELLHYVVGRAA